MLFTFQYCKRDRSEADRPVSLGISYEDGAASWSPDAHYLTFTYAPEGGIPVYGFPAQGSNICVCDLRTGKWTQVTTDGKHNKQPDWVVVQNQ